MDPETMSRARAIWATLDRSERVRRLADASLRAGDHHSTIEEAYRVLLDDADCDRRVIDRVVAEIGIGPAPRGVIEEALR